MGLVTALAQLNNAHSQIGAVVRNAFKAVDDVKEQHTGLNGAFPGLQALGVAGTQLCL